jgi:hypothetical protein
LETARVSISPVRPGRILSLPERLWKTQSMYQYPLSRGGMMPKVKVNGTKHYDYDKAGRAAAKKARDKKKKMKK